ncbi:DNA-binding NarL/FixJ family response regulator, partial [Paraburkholderia terricola]|nr:DNA-binding NarL/FixJ family response regulator [Paraburkholderia terricola]
MTEHKQIRVLVVDDHSLFRRGVIAYFTPSWTRISRQAGQAFHTKLDTDFTASWT